MINGNEKQNMPIYEEISCTESCLFIGVDSTGATQFFALASLTELGQISGFAPVSYFQAVILLNLVQ